MITKSLSQNLAEAVVQAGGYARRETEETRAGVLAIGPAFTIALSRETGGRGTTVAREIGDRLGWPVYDQELVERIGKEMGLRSSLLASVDEKRMSWLEEYMEAFASTPSVSENAYVRHLIETVLSLGSHGDCIIVGRGAAHILPAETTLRVRLVATLEDRVNVMTRELNVPREEAARYIETTDRERRAFIRDHFQRDPADPQHYDLVLNSSRFTTTQCADLILEALHRLQTRAPAR
ncbi:MAG TPA: cytidylate kinase-like family protein [Myxococcaceae bacterium]|nr:cytidylate kinase-like family protein [Myxococcaceae bacterium]